MPGKNLALSNVFADTLLQDFQNRYVNFTSKLEQWHIDKEVQNDIDFMNQKGGTDRLFSMMYVAKHAPEGSRAQEIALRELKEQAQFYIKKNDPNSIMDTSLSYVDCMVGFMRDKPSVHKKLSSEIREIELSL